MEARYEEQLLEVAAEIKLKDDLIASKDGTICALNNRIVLLSQEVDACKSVIETTEINLDRTKQRLADYEHQNMAVDKKPDELHLAQIAELRKKLEVSERDREFTKNELRLTREAMEAQETRFGETVESLQKESQDLGIKLDRAESEQDGMLKTVAALGGKRVWHERGV